MEKASRQLVRRASAPAGAPAISHRAGIHRTGIHRMGIAPGRGFRAGAFFRRPTSLAHDKLPRTFPTPPFHPPAGLAPPFCGVATNSTRPTPTSGNAIGRRRGGTTPLLIR